MSDLDVTPRPDRGLGRADTLHPSLTPPDAFKNKRKSYTFQPTSTSDLAHKNSYENAAKEIEQEKHMVTALKRLSIGNMMNYDPDLPPEDADLLFYQSEDRLDSKRLSLSSISRQPSLNSPSRRTSLRKSFISSRNSMESVDEFFDAESNDEPLDTNALLWVPANLHPEVDPEQFKVHLQTQVEEIMERKLSKKSKRSSLAASFSNDEMEALGLDQEKLDPVSAPRRSPSKSKSNSPEISRSTSLNRSDSRLAQEKRYSNPSLRALTNELETMSKLAGMDSNDAITLARTLSSASLGFTDVEILAIDELNSSSSSPSPTKEEPESTSQKGPEPESPETLKSPTRIEKHHNRPQLRLQPQAQIRPEYDQKPSNDFALKRSRRLDYRKQHTLGSQLQTSKAGKLASLRNDLQNDSLIPDQTEYSHSHSHQHHHQHQHSHSHKPKLKSRPSTDKPHPRSSQVLFSYRNPVVSPPTGNAAPVSPIESRHSPYPVSASSHAADRFERRKDPRRVPRNDRYKERSFSDEHQRIPEERVERRHASDELRDRNRRDRNYRRNGYPNEPRREERRDERGYFDQRKYPDRNDSLGDTHRNYDRQKYVKAELGRAHKSTESFKSDPFNSRESVDKTAVLPSSGSQSNLNENLDLLRSEINEFKESLTKSETPKVVQPEPEPPQPILPPKSPYEQSEGFLPVPDSPNDSDANDSDFSFEATYPDISYEDSLGIEPATVPKVDPVQQVESVEPVEPKEKNNDLLNELEDDSRQPKVTESPTQSPTQSPTKSLRKSLAGSPDRHDDHDDRETIQELTEEEQMQKQHEVQMELQRRFQSSMMTYEEKPEDEFYKEDDLFNSGMFGDTDFSEDFSRYMESQDPLTKNYDPGDSIMIDAYRIPLDAEYTQKSPVESEFESKKSLKKKKSWAWLGKERSSSMSSIHPDNMPPLPSSPSRSASSHEVTTVKKSPVEVYEPELQIKGRDRKDSVGKENMLSKIFRKKRSNSFSVPVSSNDAAEMSPTRTSFDSGVTVEYDSDSDARSVKSSRGKKVGIFKKKTKKPEKERTFEKERLEKEKLIDREKNVPLLTLRQEEKSDDNTYETEQVEQAPLKTSEEYTYQLRNQNTDQPDHLIDIVMEDFTKSDDKEEKVEKKENPDKKERKAKEKKEEKTEDDTERKTRRKKKKAKEVEEKVEEKPLSTIDVQEKLKKSIKRTSRANQPIEFTDSAFGFPLPPPSQSTLVMLDYRFPVHVERAIYRLSHLKLANPKRSLREQVLLSNFMYAYLNLVDHTLHLEQQMNESEVIEEEYKGEFEQNEKDQIEGTDITIDLDMAG